jgi:Transposase DDE domain
VTGDCHAGIRGSRGLRCPRPPDRGHFPTEDAARKLLYLAITKAETQWRQVLHWHSAIAAFTIHFGEADGEAFVLYDLSSSYIEGRCCPLATLGYSRDRVKGKLQVNYGLICSPAGRPVAVRVHAGNVTDQQTVPDTVTAVSERFGIEQVVFVGDRGMITQAHAQTLKEQGVDFISALKSVQIRSLVNCGDLQLVVVRSGQPRGDQLAAIPGRAARGVPQPGRRRRARPQTRRTVGRDRSGA